MCPPSASPCGPSFASFWVRTSGCARDGGAEQGRLDLLSLKTLELEARHGWAISERLRQISSATPQIGQGSFYPALHRLDRSGWIKGEVRHIRQHEASNPCLPARSNSGARISRNLASQALHRFKRVPANGM